MERWLWSQEPRWEERFSPAYAAPRCTLLGNVPNRARRVRVPLELNGGDWKSHKSASNQLLCSKHHDQQRDLSHVPVAFGNPDNVMYARSRQFRFPPQKDKYPEVRRKTTPTNSVKIPNSTMLPSNTWKSTSLPIKANETGFKNFHKRSKYISTSHLNDASLALCRRQPVPAVNDAVMQPKAPAEGYSRYLLPMTESAPQRTIVVKRSPLEYFYGEERKMKNDKERR